MKELLELIFRNNQTMIVSIIILIILSNVVYKIFDSFFKNVFNSRKTKIKKIYVDEDGDEINMN